MMTFSLTQKSDEDLVKYIIRDSKNLKFLIKRYEERLKRYILRISNLKVEDSEDILQDVFIKVYRNLNDFNPEFKFSSWIYRITHNETISYIRRIKSKPVASDLEDRELVEKISSNLNLEEEVNNSFVKEKIVDEIKKLDPKYSSALILKYLEERDYEDISDILKVPIGTVGTLINRGKKILRAALQKYNFTK